MANVRTSVEGRRGCGFRKGGGLYLVSGFEHPFFCGKLPLPCDVCPTCSQGLKPARGWTWVDPSKLAEGVECLGHDGTPRQVSHCHPCPLGGTVTKAGLVWIGEQFYPTPESFMAECRKVGFSRRITQVPRGFEVGKTWVLLGHRKAGTRWRPELGKMFNPDHPEEHQAQVPAIFTAFVPTSIEYVTKGDETEEELDHLEERGFELVKVVPKEDGGLFA